MVGRALTNETSVFIGDGTADSGCGTYMWYIWNPRFTLAKRAIHQATGTGEGLVRARVPRPRHVSPLEPMLSQLTSGMLNRFGPRYAAADAWASTCSATRQEGESGLAALQRLDELQQASLLLVVSPHRPDREIVFPRIPTAATAQLGGKACIRLERGSQRTIAGV